MQSSSVTRASLQGSAIIGDEPIESYMAKNGLSLDDGMPEMNLKRFNTILESSPYKENLEKERQIKRLLIAHLNLISNYPVEKKEKKVLVVEENADGKAGPSATPSIPLTVEKIGEILTDCDQVYGLFNENGEAKNHRAAMLIYSLYVQRLKQIMVENADLFTNKDTETSVRMYLEFVILCSFNHPNELNFSLVNYDEENKEFTQLIEQVCRGEKILSIKRKVSDEESSLGALTSKPFYKKYQKVFNIGREILRKSIKPYIFAISETSALEACTFKHPNSPPTEGWAIKFRSPILVGLTKSAAKNNTKMNDLYDVSPIHEIIGKMLAPEKTHTSVIQRRQQLLKTLDIGNQKAVDEIESQPGHNCKCIGVITGLDIKISKDSWSVCRFLEQKMYYYEETVFK